MADISTPEDMKPSVSSRLLILELFYSVFRIQARDPGALPSAVLLSFTWMWDPSGQPPPPMKTRASKNRSKHVGGSLHTYTRDNILTVVQ